MPAALLVGEEKDIIFGPYSQQSEKVSKRMKRAKETPLRRHSPPPLASSLAAVARPAQAHIVR